MNFKAANRRKLAEFFQSGCKTAQGFGIEIEHIVLHKNTHLPASYEEESGIATLLERMKPFYEEAHYDGSHLVALSRGNEHITLEPAAQLEISAGPFENLLDAKFAYACFRKTLDPLLDELGLYTPMLGYVPTVPAKTLKLIPKFRYDAMNAFLGAEAYEGVCMMRASSSLQISIDFRDERDAMRKFRVSEKIAPILALMADNSPFYEGKNRHGHMARFALWTRMQQDRCGVVPGSLGADFGFDDYADYILTRRAILVPYAADVAAILDGDDGERDAAVGGGAGGERGAAGADAAAAEAAGAAGADTGEAHKTSPVPAHIPEHDDHWLYAGAHTFDDLYAHRAMTDDECMHALSMVFPDTRLKNFVEIRPADALPLSYALGYMALIKSIFYSDDILEVLDRSLAPYGEQDVLDAKQSLIELGYQGRAYGHGAAFWADKLVTLALDTMTREERIMFEPLRSLVYHRETLANMVAHFFPLHTVFDGTKALELGKSSGNVSENENTNKNATSFTGVRENHAETAAPVPESSIQPDEDHTSGTSLLVGTFPSWSAACVCTYAGAGHALSGMWPPRRSSVDYATHQQCDGEHNYQHACENASNPAAASNTAASNPTAASSASADALPSVPVIGILPRYDTEFTNLTLSEGYITGIIAAGGLPLMIPLTFDRANVARILDLCDGFLIPGGPDITPSLYGRDEEPQLCRTSPMRDAMEFMLIPEILKRNIPILGVCRGMQALGVSMGCTLNQHIPTKYSHSDIKHVQSTLFAPPSHAVKIDASSQLYSLLKQKEIHVNTIHHQSLETIARGVRVSAYASDGVVEAIELPGYRFALGVQWHPELLWRTHEHAFTILRALVCAAASTHQQQR